MGDMNLIPWEVVTGCERLTPGCDNCPTYWEHKKAGKDYHPRIYPDRLNDPLENKIPSHYIVAPGSDLFHESIRVEFIEKVFDVMTRANWHQFDVASKRIERMVTVSDRHLTWPSNALALTAVEHGDYKWRIDEIRKISARRMISFGPLIGPVGDLDLEGIEVAGLVEEYWGPSPRKVSRNIVDDIKTQCVEQGVQVTEFHWLYEGESNVS